MGLLRLFSTMTQLSICYCYYSQFDGDIGKAKKKIINWTEYNKALYRRGSATFWIDDSAMHVMQNALNQPLLIQIQLSHPT